MQLVRGLYNFHQQFKQCAITIGNFDGVHLGHQALINKTCEIARKQGVSAVLMTFEPQPNEFFKPDQAVRLMSFSQKYRALKTTGIDAVVCLRFDEAFAAITAEHFVSDILVEQLGVQQIVIGDDFRFGQRRQGDVNLLQSMAPSFNFEVHQLPTLQLEGERVSTTRIKNALLAGDLAVAQRLLGRPYQLFGNVVKGDQRGREWGFPTANIHLHHSAIPMTGIFAVKVHGVDDQPLLGVASLGVRPMFAVDRPVLEVFLFDFDRDIYGAELRVDFIEKLRDEEKYDSIDQLVAQIHRDVAAAKAVLTES